MNLADLIADPTRLAEVPPAELPALVLQLAALQAGAAARLQALASAAEADDCECYDAEEVARRLRCSVDLVRQRGEEWGIAKVLARDSRDRPTRVVYPKALLRTYLRGSPNGKGAR